MGAERELSESASRAGGALDARRGVAKSREALETRPPAIRSPYSLALVLCLVTLVLFIFVGGPLQALNVAFGLWFSEVFIFFGAPWVALRLSGRDPVRYAGLPFSGWQAAAFGFLLGVANFFALVVPLQYLALLVTPDWLEELVDPSRIFRDATPVELFFIVAGVGVTAPLCEEYFFRGVFQQGLASRRPPASAVVLTALIFSAFHLDPVGFLARFELGLLFGFLFLRSGSLWPGVMAHAANNLVSTALYFGFEESIASGEETDPVGVLLVSGLGLLALSGLLRTLRARPLLLAVAEPARDIPAGLPASRGAVIWPWVAGAATSIALLVAVDWRGIRLAQIDARNPLPRLGLRPTEADKAQREQLRELRRKARAGGVPLEQYAEARRALREAANGKGGAGRD